MPIAETFSAAVLLLLVIDPFGNVPIVVSALSNVAPARRTRVVFRECLAAYVILLAFMFGGRLSCSGCSFRKCRSPSQGASSCS